MDPTYIDYLSEAGPEYIEMQANYLRMLANYYNSQTDVQKIDSDQENVLERSLRAESVFLSNEIEDFQEETTAKPIENYEEIQVSRQKTNDFLYEDSSKDFSSAIKKSHTINDSYIEPFEDRPIKTALVPFEQLLERELKKNNFAKKNEENLFAPRVKTNLGPKKNEISDESPNEMPQKYEYLKRKSLTSTIEKKSKPNLSFRTEVESVSTPHHKNEQVSPSFSNKSSFLKKGEGKIRVKQDVKVAKVKPKASESEKSEFSDKEDEKNTYLDEQIQHYLNENKKLQKLIKEVEEKKKRLDKEKADFLNEKKKEKEDFEKWKEEESHKLRRDRLILDKKLKAQGRDKEEIAELKGKIEDLQKVIEENQKTFRETLRNYEGKIENLKKVKEKTRKKSESEESIQESIQESKHFSIESSEENKENFEEFSFDEEKHSSEAETPLSEDEKVSKSGKKEIVYNNGIKKEIYPDGYSVVYFKNNDIKQCFPDGRTVYHFSDAKTTQTTFPDGLQLFKFSNGQVEKHFPDGSKEISYEDGTVKCIYPDGQEESVFPDGTVQTLDVKGVKFIEFVNGQQDTIYPNGLKIRRFPDGRVRKIMPDGKVIEQ